MTQTLELPVSELKQALAGLAKVIPGKAGLPILAQVRVEPDGPNAVCLQGTDLDSYASCRIPARNPDQFPACTVAFASLARLAKASRGDLALVREEDGRINVRYPIGQSTAKTPIDSLPIAEWPLLPAVNGSAGPLAESFKPALRQAMECASRESGRYVLQGVCLDVSQKDCHTLVATDGRHLFAANTFSFPLAQPVNRTYLARALRFGFAECDLNSDTDPVQFTAPGRKFVAMPVGARKAAPPASNPQPQSEAAPTGAPSAGEPNPTPTEPRKPMTDKAEKTADSPLKEAVGRIEEIKETLKGVLNDLGAVLATIRLAEKEKKATEKEVEAVRATLRSLQKVEI